YRRTGEKIWFEKIYYYFMPKIYNYFYFRTSDRQMSEDLASEVFIKVYKDLQTKKFNSRSFNVWIYTIARNQLIDFFRKNKKEQAEMFLTDWQDEDILQNNSIAEDNFIINNSSMLKKEFAFENIRLVKAMEKLTHLQKNVLLLMFVMDFGYEGVADIMKKKQSTIRGIVFRAVSILKNEIQNEQ
ncbi:MAG: RNA polymerase sigma factor, partial [Actinomycetota bacterium]